MRPAFRIVPAALAAFVVALALVTSAQSHRAPPPPTQRAGTVSSNIPYVAPWQSGFERFSTQIYHPPKTGTATVGMVIPSGQWWRIVYFTGFYIADVNAANRVPAFQVVAADGAIVLTVAPPVTLVASQRATMLFGPGLTSFGNTTDPTQEVATTALPDVLWPQGSTIQIIAVQGLAGDQINIAQLAVEIYTEGPRGNLVPAKLTPTPLIP